MIWKTESVRRMDEVKSGRNFMPMYFMEMNVSIINLPYSLLNKEDNGKDLWKGQMMVISSENCVYEVELNVDYPKTIFRVRLDLHF